MLLTGVPLDLPFLYFGKKKNFSGNIFGTSGENVSHPKRLCFSCVVATHVTLRFTDEAIQAITTSFDS